MIAFELSSSEWVVSNMIAFELSSSELIGFEWSGLAESGLE